MQRHIQLLQVRTSASVIVAWYESPPPPNWIGPGALRAKTIR